MRWIDIPQDCLIKVNQELEKLRQWDAGTFDHCHRVGLATRDLAVYMGLDSYSVLVSQFSGLLHDVGKRLTPKDILSKPAKLTDEEYKIMKDHATASVKIIEPLTDHKFFQDVSVAVQNHHERYDGKGYPNGVMGEKIPLIARMILIVDTVDAMTQDRAYRKGLPMEVAYSELIKFAGLQFDSQLVDVYLEARGVKTARKVG